jgi:hypothetical protein
MSLLLTVDPISAMDSYKKRINQIKNSPNYFARITHEVMFSFGKFGVLSGNFYAFAEKPPLSTLSRVKMDDGELFLTRLTIFLLPINRSIRVT